MKGPTIAVLGCGLDVPYPWANRNLKESIIREGLVISEYEEGTQPVKYTFPVRNRIISGLAECGVVVEARLNSGALITAENLNTQGKDVYLVPGNINSASSMGSNGLLRDGATLLTAVDEILDYMHIKKKEDPGIIASMGEHEKAVYRALLDGREMTIGELSQALRLGPSRVNGIVTILEMKGLVYTSLGKVFIAKI
ncbi:MAG: DNA-processing protein DprA [Anaerovoracaceae bacterium]